MCFGHQIRVSADTEYPDPDSAMSNISPAQSKVLLEKYVEAKDNNRPQRIHEAFAPDAVLTFSIATDTISFPPKSEGADAIATTLVSEFATKFDRCRTYYVGDSTVQENLLVVPWLVLMREMATSTLRAGKGFYKWGFVEVGEGDVHVSSLHIHIERMDSLPDPDGAALAAMQAPLPYPWLPAKVMKHEIENCIAMRPLLEPLRSLAEPTNLNP